MLVRLLLVFLGSLATVTAAYAQKQLLWGDTHLHTSYSFDAFLNGNLSADPDVAYRYAKGMPVIHPYNRTRVQIETPLDFLVVSDHAEFYGGIKDIYENGIQDPDPNPLERLAYWYQEREIREAIDTNSGPSFFAALLPQDVDPYDAAKSWIASNESIPGAKISQQNAWNRMIEIATHHNEPGEFTTVFGWEWSTVPGGANLHRVVITDANAEQASQFLPFASVDSPYPEDLWQWMQETGDRIGAHFLAIPHNSNISKGVMFDTQTLHQEKFTADYASRRARFEPVVEITQIKGDSETHPSLSPDDEFADFETYPWYIQQTRTVNYKPQAGDYIRSALGRGLEYEQSLGVNPYQFGVIGSTDSHTGLSSAEEPNFWGKMAYGSIPERKQSSALAIGPTGWSMQAGGLAAVWAEENSRSAIVAAFQRREVYATTGPRIRLHLVATNQSISVPMGGELKDDGASPTFTLTAERDPKSAGLDRLQIVKGWLDETGTPEEVIYNVAWSGNRVLGADGLLPSVADTVNRTNGTYKAHGAAVLEASWQDPDYEPQSRAFYYARVLEVPTPRHALLDAIALGLEEPTTGPSVIQERAYSSPVWLKP